MTAVNLDLRHIILCPILGFLSCFLPVDSDVFFKNVDVDTWEKLWEKKHVYGDFAIISLVHLLRYPRVILITHINIRTNVPISSEYWLKKFLELFVINCGNLKIVVKTNKSRFLDKREMFFFISK